MTRSWRSGNGREILLCAAREVGQIWALERLEAEDPSVRLVSPSELLGLAH